MAFKFLNPERMYPDFPWQLWAIGWLAIFKALLWLAYEPAVNETLLRWVRPSPAHVASASARIFSNMAFDSSGWQ